MISYQNDVFTYNSIIFVNDSSEYVDLNRFTNDKPTNKSDDPFAPLHGTKIIDDDESELNNNKNNSDIDFDDENEQTTENTTDKPKPVKTQDNTIFEPSKSDLELVDHGSLGNIDSSLLKNDITILNTDLMLESTPIWLMKGVSDRDNILRDYSHYKNARFAIQFSDTINVDLKTKNADDVLKMRSVNVDQLRKFKLSYLEIPTEQPYEDYNIDNLKRDNPNKLKKPKSDNDDKDESLEGGAKKDIPTRKIPLITFTDMTLFKSTTLMDLKYIIAFELNINVTNIRTRIRDVGNLIFPQSKLVTDSSYEWVHQLYMKEMMKSSSKNKIINETFDINQSISPFLLPTSNDDPINPFINPTITTEQSTTNTKQSSSTKNSDVSTFTINELTDKTVSIGNNPIIITIVKNSDSRANIYEEIFYPNYLTTASYYKSIMSHAEKQKMSEMNFSLNIQQVVIKLIYKGPPEAHANINIVKLFNMNHVNEKCSKIYLQSKIYDDFRCSTREYQYIKVFKNTANHFKGIDSLYNTCSFYLSENIIDPQSQRNSGIIAYHMDVAENMTLTFSFTNTNTKNDYDYIMDMCLSYIANNAIKILRKIKINETIYNTEFRYDYYIPVIDNISAGFNISNTTIEDLSHITEIMDQEIPTTKFRTRSSICFSCYSFYNLAYWYHMMYLGNSHEFLTSPIVFKDIFPYIHCMFNDETHEMNVTLVRMSSFENLRYCASLIIASVNKPSTNIVEDIKFIDVSTGKIDINAVRKMADKYDKKLLKLLTKLDPVLFGPRYVKTQQRSYSGLCQKKEQRPIPLTDEEYEELLKHDEFKPSITRLQNQTYPEQSLCLFCADKEFKYLNYHHFPNQKCIIRCTSKPSNKNQYDYCIKELNAENTIKIDNKYENQTITLYNTLITKGRKCRVPEEIRPVLANYILIKLDIDSDKIENYCLDTWGKHAFIIQRVMSEYDSTMVCNKYSILTDYSSDVEYVLILKSEADDSYFAFITEGNNPKPLSLNDNAEIKDFFVTHVKQTNDNNNLLRFVEKVFNANFSHYSTYSMREIIHSLRVDFNLKYFVHDNYIYGVLVGNTVYMTPKLHWIFDSDGGVHNINLFTLGNNIKSGEYTGPSIETLSFKHIRTIYVDYNSQQVKMIRFDATDMFIKPFIITSKYANIDTVQFDYNAYLQTLITTGRTSFMINNKDTDVMNFEIGNVINTYIYIYLMRNNAIKKSEFFKFMANIGAITNGATYTRYCDKGLKNFISWRNSRINVDTFVKYLNKYINFDVNEVIATNYQILRNEMNTTLMNNEVIDMKIITS